MWQSAIALSIAASQAPTEPAARAQHEAVPIASLRDALAGEWEGSISYRDYQDGRMFELPMRTTIRPTGDGLTQIHVSRFDEGRGRAPVYITTISGFVSDPARLVSSFFRAGRPVDVQTEAAQLQRYDGPLNWTVIYSQTGEDDDRPAEIRVTETRDGDSLLAVKEVRPSPANGAPWAVRNQVRLRRVSAPR